VENANALLVFRFPRVKADFDKARVDQAKERVKKRRNKAKTEVRIDIGLPLVPPRVCNLYRFILVCSETTPKRT
jgi:hypothetical protein